MKHGLKNRYWKLKYFLIIIKYSDLTGPKKHTHGIPRSQKKFRKNGGGVLIGHRNDLEVASNKINIASAQAELLSVM